MKKIFKALYPTCFILFVIFSIIGCDKDFSSIDSDVIGADNANFSTPDKIIPIRAYNKKLDSVQISNLAANLLGVFNDPVYGQTRASIVTQIAPSTYGPDFGVNPVIDSVFLTIPYYSTVTSITTNTDGTTETEYELDSLYGNSAAPIKLSIYRNSYFLSTNSGFNESQVHYSNANNADKTINSALTENTNINFDDFITYSNPATDSIYQNDDFMPINEEIVLTTLDDDGEIETSTTLTPSIRVLLNSTFWKAAILDQVGTSVLSNFNNFQNYFRGLYFKAEPVDDDGDGSMFLLNLADSNANITIYYSKDTSETDDTRIQSTYTLNFGGNKINTFVNNLDPALALSNGNKTEGDQTLYLKNAASMAVVDLFGTEDLNNNDIPDELEDLRAELKDGTNQNALINEAQLIIYEDDVMKEFPEDDNGNDYSAYDRIYAYDIKNNTPLIDYFFDQTTDTNSPLFSKFVHLGLRNEESEGSDIWKYKIRITEHLNRIIFQDSTNYKIGLVISNNVNYTNNSLILNSEDGVTSVPAASIISPRGTILYGSNENVDVSRRMSLKIFYTKPK